MNKILVLDFGGQYNLLIARRIRNLHVLTEIKPYNKVTLEELKEYQGIVFTGGPNSVNDPTQPTFDKEILNLNIPLLGICYGHQLIAHLSGGIVSSSNVNSEYGQTQIKHTKSKLFTKVPKTFNCWMSHHDQVTKLSSGYKVIASTKNCNVAAYENKEKNIYGVQFHPEVLHTEFGIKILSNFVFNICNCKKDWYMDNYALKQIALYKEKYQDKKVLLAVSGGVDSTVCAYLLDKAIGKNLTCVFVNHGLLRKNEAQEVESMFKNNLSCKFISIDASNRFLNKLANVVEPEAKRKIIGNEFIRVFEDISKDLESIKILAQGTIYPDVVESGKSSNSVIKSHHNVGGLPSVMEFNEILEPLRYLFKDEVRELGKILGIPLEFINRQPFPGPGLAVRIIGDITKEKISILQDADAILREEIKNANLNINPSQYFAVLTNLRSVGVKGDERSYGYTLALRSVDTDDFMTAKWTHLSYELLEKISNRITNKISDINRVVYDITTKPPATIEWE